MNPADLIVAGIVIAAVIAAVIAVRVRKKRGKSCCGDCSCCEGCPDKKQ